MPKTTKEIAEAVAAMVEGAVIDDHIDTWIVALWVGHATSDPFGWVRIVIYAAANTAFVKIGDEGTFIGSKRANGIAKLLTAFAAVMQKEPTP